MKQIFSRLTKTVSVATALAAVVAVAITSPVYAQQNDERVILEMEQHVRNLTTGEEEWKVSTNANPGDEIEFRITVYSVGQDPAENVMVRTTLPEGITYNENLQVGGSPVSGTIIGQSLPLGTIGTDASKRITFDAVVEDKDVVSTGDRLITTSIAYNTENSASITAEVRIGKTGVPSDVSTAGFGLTPLMAAILVTLVVVFGGTYIYFARYYVMHHVVQSSYETRTERKLAAMKERVKQREQGKW